MDHPNRCFLIVLRRYRLAQKLMERAIDTAKQHGWKLELFDGVEGNTVSSSEDWRLWNVTHNKIDPGFYAYARQAGARGVFLSHWLLWFTCVRLNETIGVFEHDVVFHKPQPTTLPECDVYKFNTRVGVAPWTTFGSQDNPVPSGKWWEGACAYYVTPTGAKKLIRWVNENGMLPPDVLMAENVVNVEFDYEKRVEEKVAKISYVDNFPKKGYP